MRTPEAGFLIGNEVKPRVWLTPIGKTTAKCLASVGTRVFAGQFPNRSRKAVRSRFISDISETPGKFEESNGGR